MGAMNRKPLAEFCSFVLPLLGLFLITGPTRAASDSCALNWERLENPPVLALASDTVYYAIRLIPESDDIALVLQGEMPDARYVSLTSYEPNANAFASLIDASIQREADGISYRVAVVPPGADMSRLTVPLHNRLERPSVSMPKVLKHGVTLWYRVSVPYAQVDDIIPPRIQAYSLQSGQREKCPQGIVPSSPVNALAVKKSATLPKLPLQDGLIDSFHVSADFDYQNRENGYLNAAITYRSADELALFRFLAPRVSSNFSALRPDESWSEAEVRLFSISLISRLGMNRVTRHDTEFPLTVDIESGISSVVTVILGDTRDAEVMSYAQAKGYTVLPRATGLFPRDILIYRQQAAIEYPMGGEAFLGHVRKFVPVCTAENREQGAACAGRCFIGPYAPRGRICTKSELLADQCRVELLTSLGCS
jgi:hypothetical protein